MDDFKTFLINDGKSKNTIKSYIMHLEGYKNWYIDSFGKKLEKLYRQSILEYKSYLLNIKKDSEKTVNAKISALIKYNEYLVKLNVQNDIVVTKKDSIKIQLQNSSPALLTKKDVECFRRKILKKEGTRNYAIVTIMAYGGLRISEVINLNINDINLASHEIVVKNTISKANKQRIVYINNKIIKAIIEYLKIRPQIEGVDYLFISEQKNRIDRTGINKMFNKYSNNITPCTLRHFYCSNALESGCSVHEVANQAGHSNIHTTLLYKNYKNPSKDKIK